MMFGFCRLAHALVFIVILSLVTRGAYASSKLQPKAYSLLPEIPMMSVAPIGNRIAFLRVSDGQKIVVVYDLVTKQTLANYDVSTMDVKNIQFLNEDKLILRLNEEKKALGFKGEIDFGTAFVADVKTKKIVQLLRPGNRIYLGQGGLGRIVGSSAAGKYLYMPAWMENRKKSGAREFRFTLMRVDVASPVNPSEHVRGHKRAIDYFVDDEGQVLARELWDDVNNLHQLQARVKGDWIDIYKRRGKLRTRAFIGLSPDMRSVVAVDSSGKYTNEEYLWVSLADGEESPIPIAEDKKDIEHVYRGLDRVALGVRYSGFHPSYLFLDDALQKRVDDILAQFVGRSVYILEVHPSSGALLVYVTGLDYAGDYLLFRNGESPLFLASSRSHLRPEQIHPVIETAITAGDGLRIPVLLTVPLEKQQNPVSLPTILMPHGGPESYDSIGFHWMAQAFANEGYLVVQPQFRGSSGFGKQFLLKGRGEWGKRMRSDLSDTIAELVRGSIVNKDRVCIVGGSYGGYAALSGGAFTPELYRCVISLNGVSDLPKMLYQERQAHGKYSWALDYWDEVIKAGELEKKDLDAISPVNFASQFTAPVLLLHGDADDVVDISQSKVMYKKLKSAKKKVEFIRLKDETHHLEFQETRDRALQEMLEFVLEHNPVTSN